MKTEALSHKIDEIAKKWDAAGLVVVYKDGQFIHESVYGYQDRAHKKPIAFYDTYALSLRSQFFLGCALMVLIDKKMIRLEDRIDQYIPEYKDASKIKIKHLVTHSSGIADYFYSHKMIFLNTDLTHQSKTEEEQFRIEKILYNQSISFFDVYKIIKDGSLEFYPGERQDEWSSSNLVFIQEIVERISGMKLFEFLNQNVFIKWGMLNVSQGANPSTVSYGCFKETKLIRLPISKKIDHAITLTNDDIKALMQALINQKVFKKTTWEKALRINSEGYTLIAENSNGMFCCEAGLLGFEMNLYFHPMDHLAYVHLTHEQQIMHRVNEEWFYFRKEMRLAIEAETTYPKHTKLVKYCEKNAWSAMGLKVDKSQQSFVLDAKTTLSYALIRPSIRKTYVLSERERSIGILVLSIDKKNSYFNIDVVLIDRRYQRRGFGKIMLTHAIEILRKNGAKSIEIGVSRFNIPAQKLYKSLNFKETSVYEEGMGLRLEL